mmetsp:Transcript_4327/g.6905  ORF Transcript_4327/g.6905 Transcript_4327/m.6905 type:complete len:286 (-) Transcript_4327:47-904(-)
MSPVSDSDSESEFRISPALPPLSLSVLMDLLSMSFSGYVSAAVCLVAMLSSIFASSGIISVSSFCLIVRGLVSGGLLSLIMSQMTQMHLTLQEMLIKLTISERRLDSAAGLSRDVYRHTCQFLWEFSDEVGGLEAFQTLLESVRVSFLSSSWVLSLPANEQISEWRLLLKASLVSKREKLLLKLQTKFPEFLTPQLLQQPEWLKQHAEYASASRNLSRDEVLQEFFLIAVLEAATSAFSFSVRQRQRALAKMANLRNRLNQEHPKWVGPITELPQNILQLPMFFY